MFTATVMGGMSKSLAKSLILGRTSRLREYQRLNASRCPSSSCKARERVTALVAQPWISAKMHRFRTEFGSGAKPDYLNQG